MENKLEIIITIKDYLPRLINGIQQFIYELRESYSNHEKTTMVDIIDGLNWVMEAIFLTKEEIRGEIKSDDLLIIFEAMLEAMQNEDYVLLTDLLEYEIIPKLEEWNKIIEDSTVPIV